MRAISHPQLLYSIKIQGRCQLSFPLHSAGTFALTYPAFPIYNITHNPELQMPEWRNGSATDL